MADVGIQVMIDKTIPTPLYYQLIQILKHQIESHNLKPGDVIPTEQELMEKYDISRATVRQAILQLVNDGYLRREKSKGTFVTAPPGKFRFLQGLSGFSTEMNRRGTPHGSKILFKAIVSATDKVAERLAIPPGEQVFYIQRLRIVNDQPFLIDRHYIPYRLVPGIELIMADDVSLYHTLEVDYHLYLHHGWREFEPVRPSSKEEIELLEIFPTTQLLYVESVLYDKKNEPVDYFEAKIHGKFTVDIVNASEQ
jgi:GntR family transcriptional regulator